jgi:divalent metal cation (Fe/Co/Zn/Cd) transporter
MAKSVDGVLATNGLRTRQVGRNVWVDMEILVSPRCSVERASGIADEVRGRVLRKVKNVEDVVVCCRADSNGATR